MEPDEEAGPADPASPVERPRTGRQQADHELRLALMGAVPLLAIGQVLLLTGLRLVAILGIALPGTIGAFFLARRWTRLAADDSR
jgi:hypothetical protein